jgi:two-component system, response regulator YesN
MIRVLIVDDDKLARKGLISIMPWSSHGMEVVGEAANGAKALEFLGENPVDLMFVDLAMPVLSGIELIQEVRKRYPGLCFVVLTFHEDFEHVQTTFRLGALDYISKVRLEIEDYEQIFERIRKNFTGRLQENGQTVMRTLQPEVRSTSKTTENCGQEEQWRKIEQDWRALYWLYDEIAFQRLCASTVELNPPVRRLEGLFMRVLSQVEAATHINMESWVDIDSIQSAITWIQHYRGSLYLRAAQSAGLTETSICILKAVLFIREQIATPLHAEAAAAYINMSRSYFSQCFKKLVGLTFNDYLRQERIRIAMQLLCQSNQTIMWIANAVGYGDVKYFSHVFHEQTDLLPSEFRAQFHKGDK